MNVQVVVGHPSVLCLFAFDGFSLVPKLVHFGKSHFFELFTHFGSAAFYVIEAAYEFGVGLFEGIFGVDAI